MRSFPTLKGGHDVFNNDKDCRCHFHKYLASSLLFLDHHIKNLRHKQQRKSYIHKKYFQFLVELLLLLILLFFSWCFTLNYIADSYGDWYKQHGIYYLGVSFVAVTYCYFGILLISIIHNTPFLYLPNLILFVPICCINVSILVLYTKKQSDQFIDTNEELCKFWQCKYRTFYWVYIDVIAGIVPFFILIPFFAILIKIYKYSAYKNYKANYKKNTLENNNYSHELNSPSLPTISHNQNNSHSEPASPHVPPTGKFDFSPHNAPLAHPNNIGDIFDVLDVHDINEQDDEKRDKLSDNGPASTLLNAGHIVIDRKERTENKYSLPNTIRTTLKPNRISCLYCLRSICSVNKLYWLFIPPCQDNKNTLKLYSYTALYVIGIAMSFATQYLIAQIKQQRIETYFIYIYFIIRCIIFIEKQMMKYIARKIDGLRLNFVDESTVLGYNSMGSEEKDVESIPFRDQISFEYATEYFAAYLYYDSYRYLFVAQNVDFIKFIATLIIHFIFNILDNIIRGSHWYWSSTFEIQRDQLDTACLVCITRDLSQEKEWRKRITADVNIQFIACCVNTLFWLLVIPSQRNYWKHVYHIDIIKSIEYIIISCGVDMVLFLLYLIWYRYKHKMDVLRTFVSIYTRHEWKLVCSIAIISGTLSQKWYFLLENFDELGNY